MHIENCFPQLPRKLTNRSCRQNCSFEPSGPMDTMVQLFRLDLSWKTVLATFKSLLSFCLDGTCDTLTSLSNLHSWCIHSEPSCYLCSKAVRTTSHILGACKVAALQQGKFTYHHDSVLLASLIAL